MEGYKEIFSTNNPIQLSQIEYAMEKAEIDFITKGKKALEIGNTELTGIRGASIFVSELQFTSAKKVLNSMDLDTEEGSNEAPVLIYFLGLALLCVVLYMIYKAYIS